MDISSPMARQLSDEELRKKLLTTRASTGVMEKPFYETPANAGDVARANPIEYFVNEPMDKINTPQAVAPATRQAAMGRPQNPAEVKPVIPPAESEMLTKPQISVYGNQQVAPVVQPAEMPTPVSTQRQVTSGSKLTQDTVISPVTKPTETTPPSTPKTDGGSISDYYDLIGKALITFGPAMFAKLTGDPNMAAAWGGGQAGLKANLDIDNEMYKRGEANRKVASDEALLNKKFEQEKELIAMKQKDDAQDWTEIDPIYDPNTKLSTRVLMNKKTGAMQKYDDVVAGKLDKQFAPRAPIVKAVQMDDGSTEYVVVDSNNIEDAKRLEGQKVGYAQKFIKDQATKEYRRLPTQGKTGSVTGPRSNMKSAGEPITAGGAELMAKARVEALKDTEYRKQYEIKSSAEKALVALKRNSPVDRQYLMRQFAKMSGEVGMLTSQDVESFGGSPALLDWIAQKGRGLLDGKFTEENIRYYSELVRVAHNMASASMVAIQNQYVDAYSEGLKRAGMPKAIETLKSQNVPVEIQPEIKKSRLQLEAEKRGIK